MSDFHEDQFGEELDDRLEAEEWLRMANEMEGFLTANAIGVVAGEK